MHMKRSVKVSQHLPSIRNMIMAFTDQPFRNQMVSKMNCIHIWQLHTIATT